MVVTRHAGIPDVVIEGRTGWLVDEHDVGGMAVAMLALLDSPALAAQFGAAARDHVRARFSLDRSLERLWTIIASVIPS